MWPWVQLWWEHELIHNDLTNNFWSSIVHNTFYSQLPHPRTFEFGGGEFSIRTERPELLLVSRQEGAIIRPDYWSTIRFNRAPNRPAALDVVVESEITDWTVRLPWWDVVGSVRVPTGNVREVPR